MIDTHFHLGSDDFLNPSEVLERARQEGVGPFIISGCNRKGIEEALQLVSQFEDVYASIGYHPEVADLVRDQDILFLEEALKHPKVVAVGEIGLDYHYGKENQDTQVSLFKQQLSLAITMHKPVVIHTRDAIQDTYDILSQYPLKGDIHCFSGSLEMAERFLKLGYYVGIGGVITFKNSKLYEVVEKLPLDRILLETDSPYLSPEPYRGMVNGPWNIPVIARKIAEVKGMDVSLVCHQTTQNARTLFDLK